MGKTVLFSPIGGTDPIAEKNMQDGSLLHICRVYKPDKVVLYLSKEMLEKHEKDDRYLRCLRMLEKYQHRTMEYELVKRPDLEDVQEYDFFYHDFYNVIKQLMRGVAEDDTLLINVSSGTPAMKSGLLVLQTLGEFPAKMIQVVTPVGHMNEHEHSKQYALEELWELDSDNEDEFVNRCVEVTCPTLSDMVKTEILKKHLLVYDYRAARVVADSLNGEYKDEISRFIKIAEDRVLLKNNAKTGYHSKKVDYDLPVRDSKYVMIFEYTLVMGIKLKRGEYGDYVRSITPLYADIVENMLEERCHIRVSDYCRHTKDGLHWDQKKLVGTEIDKILQDSYKQSFRYGVLNSDSMLNILLYKIKDPSLLQLLQDLREVEKNIRNLAAHEIASITQEKIKEKTGFTADQIFHKIQKAFQYMKVKIPEDAWNSYDEMNRVIIRLFE